MAWFDKDFAKFFSSLRKNNNKEWFDKNKLLYEQKVKAPFEAFIGEMIKRVGKLDPEVRILPKDAIFRIYKDVRFSKDKTPYKDHVSALLGPSGRKDMETPSFYLQLNDKSIMVAGGAYMPEKEFLNRIRLKIASQPKALSKITDAKEFKSVFGEIAGEKNKILPPEFREDAAKLPILFNKQFYFQTDLDAALLVSDKLPEELMKVFKAGQPLNLFLRAAKLGK